MDETANATTLRPLAEVARRLGLKPTDLAPYGRNKAKIDLGLLERPVVRTAGKYVVVTAINPTPFGEGKTLHTVGLSMALNRIGQRAVCTIRQPSMGPVFGVKGGGTGGGQCQVVPPEEVNLHLTGDFHAVTAANNLLAAFLDTSLLLDNPLDIDPATITWRRVVDMNDRALREIEIGLGGAQNGVPRRTGFDITAASEVMAILGLSRDLGDLRRRLASIIVGANRRGDFVTAADLKATGPMTALLREALSPNLVQTSEGTPAIVHTGPFANIAHGNSSIVGDLVARACSDWVITESGFGSDMGAEKMFNIKCRVSGLRPDAAVLVATIRALKMHSGRFKVTMGEPLPAGLLREDLDVLRQGLCNLEKHIEIVRLHGLPVVVAINVFPTDSPAEIELVRSAALAAGAFDARPTTLFADGGRGGEELAHALVKAADGPSSFRMLYPEDMPLQDKIAVIATKVYGAARVEYAPQAASKLNLYETRGFGRLPVCIAKTQSSLSHDPALKGRPTGFTFPVQDVRLYAGAGFVCALAGAIQTMPGLGRKPGGANIDVDEQGRIVGMF